MKRLLIILGGFGMLVGITMVLPALGQHKQHPEIWTSREVMGIIIGMTIVIGSASAFFYGMKKRKA